MNTVKGQLSISRVHSNMDDGYVEIRFRDSDACCEFASFKLSVLDFAEALFGRGFVSGEIEIRGLDVIGMKAENKVELVRGELPYGNKKALAALQKEMKKFEVDGWEGRKSDLENPHNYRSEGVQVVFFRHVKK